MVLLFSVWQFENAKDVFHFILNILLYVSVQIIAVNLIGDITSRLTSDTTTMSNALSLNFNVFIRSFIKAGWYHYQMWFYFVVAIVILF